MQLNAETIADAVVETVAIAVAPAARELAHMKALLDGISSRIALLEDVSRRLVQEPQAVDLDVVAMKAAALIPKPTDGKNAEPVDLDTLALKAAELVPPPIELDEAAIVAALQAQLDRRLLAITQPQNGRDGKDGRDGQDADPDLIKQVVAKLEAVKTMADLNSESVSTLWQRVDERLTKAIEALPVPQNGRDGKDVDAAMLEVIVAAHVERAVAAIPRPIDGKSLAPMDVEPLIQAEVAKVARAGQDGRDGVSVAWAMVDHAGMLHLTLSDGKAIQCGPVRGADVDFTAVTKAISDEVAKIPPPAAGRDGVDGKDGSDGMNGKDGLNGKDGADGLGFDDLEVVLDDAKYCALLRFKRGELVKEFALPWPYDRGVYRAGEKYFKFNFATAQGSLWAAQDETRARPGDGSKDWRLAVKRGRDGKDAAKEPSDG